MIVGEINMNIRFGLFVLFIVVCSALPLVSVLKFSDLLKKKHALSVFVGRKHNG